MKRPRQPLFLERDTYRARRATDAARLLPLVGFAALCLPLLWRAGHADGTAGSTSAGILYLFGLWIALIAFAALLARRLGGREADEAEADGPEGDAG